MILAARKVLKRPHGARARHEGCILLNSPILTALIALLEVCLCPDQLRRNLPLKHLLALFQQLGRLHDTADVVSLGLEPDVAGEQGAHTPLTSASFWIASTVLLVDVVLGPTGPSLLPPPKSLLNIAGEPRKQRDQATKMSTQKQVCGTHRSYADWPALVR